MLRVYLNNQNWVALFLKKTMVAKSLCCSYKLKAYSAVNGSIEG